MNNVTTDKLVHDLKTVVGDAEELLKATSSQGGEQINRIRARAEESVRIARGRLKDVTQAAERGAREVDAQVHENAWSAVGVAAGVGLVLGFLLGRK
jgi:ElaB/YqjD/DUF883 family membrane-anchored ribosome-binding protein